MSIQPRYTDAPNKVVAAMLSGLSPLEVTLSADTQLVLPANRVLRAVYIYNTTANAVTGGIRIGTAAAGADVVAATPVAANALVSVTGAAILKSYISGTAPTTLFISAVTAWNNAVLSARLMFD